MKSLRTNHFSYLCQVYSILLGHVEKGLDGPVLLRLIVGFALRGQPGELEQREEDDRHGGHNRRNLPDVESYPLDCPAQNPPDGGKVVGRHLHDEGRRLLVPQHRHGEDLRQGEHEEQAKIGRAHV